MSPAPPPKEIKQVDYDERVYRKGHPPHRMRNALILVALAVIGTYFAWTKAIPFKPQYELHAVFENAANIRKDSPVRIAGVNVGKVQSVESVGNLSEVTFTVDDVGRPVHEDAQVEIRPRIFLEGNFFLDVKSGSPSAPDLDDGETIPVSQTSTAVQLDQVLTTLQAPDRENLQKLLRGYGTALNHKPTAAEDKGMDPDIQGESAAQAINDSFQYGVSASRDSAIVSEALLGTEPHDFSKLIAAQAKLFGGLTDREQQLQDLVSNFNTTVGAFAAESDNLEQSIKLLGPTLERAEPALRHTNESLPFLRAFARQIRPGIAELPNTIAASQPWLSQTKALLGPDELQPIARELRLTGPPAGRAAAAGSALFSQAELLSRCVSQVLIPTGDVVLNDPAGTLFGAGANPPNYKEFMYVASHFAGETQSFDANGPYIRFQSGGGQPPGDDGLIASPYPGGALNDFLFGVSEFPPLGVQPQMGNKPPFRTDVPCHVNALPALNGPLAVPGPPDPVSVP